MLLLAHVLNHSVCVFVYTVLGAAFDCEINCAFNLFKTFIYFALVRQP